MVVNLGWYVLGPKERSWSHLEERVVVGGAIPRRGAPGVSTPHSDPRLGGEVDIGLAVSAISCRPSGVIGSWWCGGVKAPAVGAGLGRRPRG